MKYFRVYWRNCNTGSEHYEDFILAADTEDAIRKVGRLLAWREEGIDTQITGVGERKITP